MAVSKVEQSFREMQTLKAANLRRQYADKLRVSRLQKDMNRADYKPPLPPAIKQTKYLDRFVQMRRKSASFVGRSLIGGGGVRGQVKISGGAVSAASGSYRRNKEKAISAYDQRVMRSNERVNQRLQQMSKQAVSDPKAKGNVDIFGRKPLTKDSLWGKYKLWYPELDFAGLGMIPPIFLMNKAFETVAKPMIKVLEADPTGVLNLVASKYKMSAEQLKSKEGLSIWADKPGSVFDTTGAYPGSKKIKPKSDLNLYKPRAVPAPLPEDRLGLKAQARQQQRTSTERRSFGGGAT